MKILKASVRLQFTGMVLGGLPTNPLLLAYANEKRAEVGAPAVVQEEVVVTTEQLGVVDEEPKSRLVFRRDRRGGAFGGMCAVDEHSIRGVYRETLRKQGLTKRYRGLVQNIHTDPYLFPFAYEPGQLVEEARMFQAMTMQGFRSVVLIHEAIVMPGLAFVLEFHDVSGEVEDTSFLRDLLVYAGRYVGFGAGRGKSGLEYEYGLFNVADWTQL